MVKSGLVGSGQVVVLAFAEPGSSVCMLVEAGGGF